MMAHLRPAPVPMQPAKTKRHFFHSRWEAIAQPRRSAVPVISSSSLLLVLAAHATVLYGIWQHQFPGMNSQPVRLSAEILSPPQSAITAPEATSVDLKPIPRPPTPPKRVKKTPPPPKQRLLAANAPTLPAEVSVEPAPAEPVQKPEPSQQHEVQAMAAARPAQMQTSPVSLSSDLSISCPELTAPDYPEQSRRMGEEGKLMLQVELDESGQVSQTRIIRSSGYSRLDRAALAAVKTWRCRPALRDGQPVRAVALQPFNFVLQGN